MTQPGLTVIELLQWNDETAQHWKALFATHPEALDFDCDVYGVTNVRGLLRHMFAVETRYAQRLSGQPVLLWSRFQMVRRRSCLRSTIAPWRPIGNC